MDKEQFDELILSLDNYWNTHIVSSYLKLKNYLRDGHINDASNRFLNCLDLYSNLIIQFITDLQAAFKPHPLNSEQESTLSAYVTGCNEARRFDLLELKKIESKNRKRQFLPMPTLEEQMATHQIFPDNSMYRRVDFTVPEYSIYSFST